MPIQLLLALLLISPQGANGIGGHIVTPSRSTPGRIEVILEKSGAFLARTFSDNEGYYRFNNLTDGEYVVVVRLDGYEEARETASFGRNNGAVINIMMTPKGADTRNADQAWTTLYSRKVVDDYEKALEDGRNGNTMRAIERLESVVKAATDFQQAHNALGTQYQKAQRLQDAETQYKIAMQLDATYSDPLVNLGSLYIQLAEEARTKHDNKAFGAALDDAVRALNQAIMLRPNSAKAYLLLGTTYYTGNVLPRAEDSLKHALQLEVGMGEAELTLANVYIKQQKWMQALEYLDAYLKDNPKASDRDQIRQTRAKIAAQK